MDPVPRKTRRTFNERGHAHFLTYSCYRRWPLLSKDLARRWVVDAIGDVRRRLDFDLWAYVIMPEHVHLLIRPRRDRYAIEHILAALKRQVSVRAKEHLIETHNADWLQRLTVHRGDRDVFRFWQAGGGFDENLWNDRPVMNAINYIHENPVRRGLVQDPLQWRWSSAGFWAGETNAIVSLDPVDP